MTAIEKEKEAIVTPMWRLSMETHSTVIKVTTVLQLQHKSVKPRKLTALMAKPQTECSARLKSNQEVVGSIPGISTISKMN